MIMFDSVGQQAVFKVSDYDFGREGMVEVRLADGQFVLLPTSTVTRRVDGTFATQLRFSDATQNTQTPHTPEPGLTVEAAHSEDRVVLPIIEESVTVTRREVESGRVRITKTVHEEETAIDEPLLYEVVNVERRAVNQYVDTAPQTRTEGDTLIVPLVEEVLVIEKRLVLREELRITRRQTEKRHAETVTLRREEAHVERFDTDHVQ